MKDLIERLEKATGPDRGLDAAIASALGWEPHAFSTAMWWPPDKNNPAHLPRYTDSFDAAMTLTKVDDPAVSTFWRVGNDGEGGDPGSFKAEVYHVSLVGHRRGVAVSDVPACALAAAALKSLDL